MAPTILIAGSTGNTGRNVVETLSKLRETSSVLSGHRIVALTRSADGAVAQSFTKLPGVEVIEQNWVGISAEWLRKHEVVRAFVASKPQPSQFTDETMFHVAALEAGVKYVVRISTTAPNVRPDCKAFYPRSHWAIETLLGTPEFERLQWTSLQPNAFTQLYLQNAVDLIKQYRSTGKQDTLRLLGSADAPVGVIDQNDVGTVAALLLAQQDPTPHNKAKYVLNGPEDISGNQVVKLVEQYIGTKVENVIFEDMSFIEAWAENSPEPKNIILSIKHALEPVIKGLCSASTTSKEVLELAAPKRTPVEVLESMLE
ncbi:NmrA-like family protein [Xylaria flabelliformis]|nr:NmrA-like family protein [Xylaria flabelliformis]